MAYILSDAACNELEQLLGELGSIPQELDGCSDDVEGVLKSPPMSTWVGATTAARSLEPEIRKNAQGVRASADNCRKIQAACRELIENSRRINSQNVRG